MLHFSKIKFLSNKIAIFSFAISSLQAHSALAGFGPKSYNINCKLNDQDKTVIQVEAKGVIAPKRLEFETYYTANVFKNIDGDAYYIDMYDSDESYSTATRQYVSDNNWGFGTLISFTLIPIFNHRPWNELTKKNTYDYYVLPNTSPSPESNLAYDKNALLKTYFGQNDFLRAAAPFLTTIKSYTYDSPNELVDVARGRSVVVFIPSNSENLIGQGFVSDSVIPTEDQLISNGHLIVNPVTSLFPCSVEILK